MAKITVKCNNADVLIEIGPKTLTVETRDTNTAKKLRTELAHLLNDHTDSMIDIVV